MDLAMRLRTGLKAVGKIFEASVYVELWVLSYVDFL